ncbi:hypothetical protein ACFLU9_01540 [Chloroflexota bacterium]
MEMINWQITATTIYCDAVDDEVTFMVYKDRTASCIACKTYYEPDNTIRKLLANKSKLLGRKLKCDGPECNRITQYRDKLLAEEV